MDVPMTLILCAECQMPFAVTSEYDVKSRRCHNTFYCPVGHPQSYTGKSDIERVREERDTVQRLLDNARADRDLYRKDLETLKKKKCKKVK